MIVRSINDVIGTDADVHGEHWASRRFLLRRDGVPFTITETTILPGMDEVLWYRNHIEACLCLEGEATLEDLATGEKHRIMPGTLYALDRHDRHRLTAETTVRLVCVFSPALTGGETHNPDGSYPTAAEQS
jgi:L-ectoine synthase